MIIVCTPSTTPAANSAKHSDREQTVGGGRAAPAGAAGVARPGAAHDHEREQRADADAGQRRDPDDLPQQMRVDGEDEHQPSAVSVRPATRRFPRAIASATSSAAETTIGPTDSLPSSATTA